MIAGLLKKFLGVKVRGWRGREAKSRRGAETSETPVQGLIIAAVALREGHRQPVRPFSSCLSRSSLDRVGLAADADMEAYRTDDAARRLSLPASLMEPIPNLVRLTLLSSPPASLSDL